MLSQYKQNQFDFCFFFFNDTATTEIYTLSLHDALPISPEIRQLIVIVPALPSAYSTRRTASPAVLPGMFGLDASARSQRTSPVTVYVPLPVTALLASRVSQFPPPVAALEVPPPPAGATNVPFPVTMIFNPSAAVGLKIIVTGNGT